MVKDVRKKEGTQPDNSKWPAFKCKTHRISLRVCCASGGSDGFPWWGGEFRETLVDSRAFFAGNCAPIRRQLNNS